MSFLQRVAEHDGKTNPPATPAPLAATGPGEDTPYGIAALTSECETVAQAVEGTRDDVINRAAFRMARLIASGHLTETTVRNNLAAAARLTGQPEHEIQRALRDNGAITAGRNHPRIVPPRTDPNDTSWIRTQTTQVDDSAFWTARPILDHIRTFARARRACPWAVLGVVLARATTATPHWVVLPPLVGAEASLNLFVALVAPSGGGKGASEACAAAAVDLGHIETAGVGSGEGIAHLYRRRTKTGIEQVTGADGTPREAVLMRVAEIDTLAALGDRKGSTLLPELRKAWSGEDLGFAYADPAKALPLPAHSYRLGLVAGVQPGRAQWVLDDADGGTPQRFLWLPAVDPDAPDIAPDCPAPWKWVAPKWPSGDYYTHRYTIDVCETARQTIDANRLARLRGDGDALDGHALLTRLKTAAALAILAESNKVTEEDWTLSATIAEVSEQTRAGIVESLKREAEYRNKQKAEAEATRVIHITERQDAEALKKTCQVILRKLTKAPDGMTRSELVAAVTQAKRGYVDPALDSLVNTGQIEVQEGRTRRWRLNPGTDKTP